LATAKAMNQFYAYDLVQQGPASSTFTIQPINIKQLKDRKMRRSEQAKRMIAAQLNLPTRVNPHSIQVHTSSP
jgi:hypothetical protein